MKPIEIGIIKRPSVEIKYPSADILGNGCIQCMCRLPDDVQRSIEPLLNYAGWMHDDRVAPEITLVNGAAFSHTDVNYGLLAIALIDYPDGMQTELITASGRQRMMVGDVVVFDSGEWHAWIAHEKCALASMCVAPIQPNQPSILPCS